MESKFLPILNLTAAERAHPPKAIEQLKTVTEWLSASLDAIKESADAITSLEIFGPWTDAVIGVAEDALPP